MSATAQSLAGATPASSAAAGWARAACALVFGLVFTWAGALFIVQGGLLGVAALAIGAVCLLLAAPSLFAAALVSAIVFQNLALATFASAVRSATEFQAGQALNFVLLTIGGGLSAGLLFLHRTDLEPAIRRILALGAAFAALAAVFAGLGVMRADLPSALAYLRLFWTPVLALFAGLHLGSKVSEGARSRFLLLLCGLLVLLSIVEIAWPREFYAGLNYGPFYIWKRPELAAQIDPEYLQTANVGSWLNLTGQFGLDLQARRLLGPTIHPISFAYVLAVLALALAQTRRWAPLLVLAPLIFFIGSKGAIVLSAYPLVIMLVALTLGAQRAIRAAPLGLLAYASLVFVYGLRSGDLHVLGLRKGLEALVTFPVGHGLGVGGNLSTGAWGVENAYSYFQTHGVPYALESAVGVLCYQMGLFAGVLLVLVALAARRLARTAEENRQAVIPFAALLAVMVNGLYQEEAFAPVAAGLVFLMAGFSLATAIEEAPPPPR